MKTNDCCGHKDEESNDPESAQKPCCGGEAKDDNQPLISSNSSANNNQARRTPWADRMQQNQQGARSGTMNNLVPASVFRNPVDFFGIQLPPYAVAILGGLVWLWFSLKVVLFMIAALLGYHFWSHHQRSGGGEQQGRSRRGGGNKGGQRGRANIKGIGDLPKPPRRG